MYIIDRVLGGDADMDLKLAQEQAHMVGTAMYTVIRALGLKFNFDPTSPEVRELARKTLITVSEGGSEPS
jgi:hypothetical protein